MLHFDLVTPAQLAFSEDVYMVVAPGMEGEFGVMAGHMNFVSTLKPGVLTIYGGDDVAENARGVGGAAERKKYFITGGVAEVNADTGCTILADALVDLSTVTRGDAESRLTKARAAVDAAITEEQKAAAVAELQLAEGLLAAIS